MANLGDAPTTPLHQDNAAVAAALNLTGISPESNRILMAGVQQGLLTDGVATGVDDGHQGDGAEVPPAAGRPEGDAGGSAGLATDGPRVDAPGGGSTMTGDGPAGSITIGADVGGTAGAAIKAADDWLKRASKKDRRALRAISKGSGAG